jgi:hypothetical protein
MTKALARSKPRLVSRPRRLARLKKQEICRAFLVGVDITIEW